MELRRICHGVVDSTSERAFAALAEGRALHGDVHLARGQSAGRGRRGRSWWSAEGEGVFASLVLRPSRTLSPAGLTWAGGLAVLDTVRALGLAGASLDWPNDIVFEGAKLSGILAETRGLDPASPSYVLGIGLNVGQLDFPAELLRERKVTSLRQLELKVSVQEAERSLLAHLSPRLEQIESEPERLAGDTLEAMNLRARPVRLLEGEAEVQGTLIDLSLQRGMCIAIQGRERWIQLERVRGLTPA
jgi:BirA family biotin operon repressor/biotin-[acetyl-CoA-carboxylase] ligase